MISGYVIGSGRPAAGTAITTRLRNATGGCAVGLLGRPLMVLASEITTDVSRDPVSVNRALFFVDARSGHAGSAGLTIYRSALSAQRPALNAGET